MLLTPEQAAEQYAELSKTGKNFHGSLSFNRAKKAPTPRSKAVPRPPTVASPAKAPFSAAAAAPAVAPTGGALSQRRGPPSFRATLDAAASQPVLAAAPPPQTLPLAPPPQQHPEPPPTQQVSAAPSKPAEPPPGALEPPPAAAGSMLGRLSPELDDKLAAAKQQAGAAVRSLFGEEDEGGKGGSPSKDGDGDEDDEDDGRPRFLNSDHYKDALEGFFEYDPEKWLPTIRIDVTEFVRRPWQIVTGLSVLCTLLVQIFPFLAPLFSLGPDLHVILGGALSFIIVFRTNSSYDRWWEARKSWNDTLERCRILCAQVAPMLRSKSASADLIRGIMGFVVALKAHLREEKISQEEIGPLMRWEEMELLNTYPNPPLQAARRLFLLVSESLPGASKQGYSLGPVIYTEATQQLQALITNVSACERIKDTPMVFSYVATLRTFLMLFVGTLPLVMVGEYGWAAPPAISLITFMFINIEQMALEIEQPFGDDPNDLPIEGYLLQLEKELLQMLPDRQRDLRLASETPPDGTDDNDNDGSGALALAPAGGAAPARGGRRLSVGDGSTPARRPSPAVGMMDSAEQRLLEAKAAAEGALGYQRLHDEDSMHA